MVRRILHIRILQHLFLHTQKYPHIMQTTRRIVASYHLIHVTKKVTVFFISQSIMSRYCDYSNFHKTAVASKMKYKSRPEMAKINEQMSEYCDL